MLVLETEKHSDHVNLIISGGSRLDLHRKFRCFSSYTLNQENQNEIECLEFLKVDPCILQCSYKTDNGKI